MLKIPVKQHTYDRLQVLRESKTYDEFLNTIMDIALGLHCPHEHEQLYMPVYTDQLGYLDVNKTLEALDDIRLGKESDSLIKVCKDCNHARQKFR